MLRPLIWKEWHEQRWKLAFGTVMLLFFTLSLIVSELATDGEIFFVIMLFGGAIMALYSAMGVFSPERMNKTNTFLVSKPVEYWKVFLCKWFFGWLNLALPLLVCSLSIYITGLLRPEGRFFTSDILSNWLIIGILFGTIFYTMTCCFAPRNATEAFVGITGLIILVIEILYLFTSYLFTNWLIFRNSAINGYNIFFANINPMYILNNMDYSFSCYDHAWIIEQSVLFFITLYIGFRKFKRS
jgi:hypothetical protein